MLYDVLRRIKGQVNIMMWLTIILALVIVSGVYTYARYTYHSEVTGVTVTVPGIGYCAYNGMTLADCVLVTDADEPYETVSKAKTAIEAKTEVTSFSEVATTDEGLYDAEDDYGTSYYYRGDVEDNYVEYAGYIWRIIRVNGDGSVRMILQDNYTTSAFNENYDDNAYVGYMYGTTSASSYDEAHANTNDSTIKGVIDSFYTTKIQGQVDDKGNSLEDYLSDEIFCNDRSLYSGTGVGTPETNYYGFNRLYNNKSPVLTCTNQNDEFTVKTKTLEDGTEVGNGDLTYPIGLITADEVAMAGGVYGTTNSSYYLNIGSYYWTMTPFKFYYTSAYEFHVLTSGSIGNIVYSSTGRVDNAYYGVRPVVNLSSDVYVYSGTGTQDDPYQVSLTKRNIPSSSSSDDNTLSNTMLLNSTGESTVSDAIATIEAKGDPDYSTTATTDEGLYATEDDYGTSYYYRGAVEDNYVSFAGYIWRIIRRNGDGSVRMIYDGTSAYANGTSSTNRYYTTSAFNSKYGSNAYVGYMYGTVYSGATETSTTQTLQSYYYYYSDSYTFDATTGYTLTNSDGSTVTQQVWNSSLDGYYTCKSTSTTCTTMYKVSYYSIYQAKYYTYSVSGSSGSYTENIGTTLSSSQTFATRYYYGTGYTYDENNGYTLTGYAYNVYDGTGTASDLKGYYTCGSTSYYACTTLYYITSASTAKVANVTKYTLSTTDYDTTHSNDNDSTIKGVIDSFYTSKLDATTDSDGNKYSAYLSDTLFCNDRSYYSGTGIGKTSTYYYGYNRLYTNKSPSLICTNKNDEFTVKETELEDGTVVGNKALSYPIGLITADEVAMAGGVYNTSNTSYYLYMGSYYWTMTPFYFDGTYAYEFLVSSAGSLILNTVLYTYFGARPVVNLSSEVLVAGGTGTQSDPYTLTLAN